MTNEEWNGLTVLLDEGWPGPFRGDAERAYRTFLDGYDAVQVLEALHRLVHRGEKFRPSVAEVVAAITDDPGRPTWAEAYSALFGPRGAIAGARGKAGEAVARAEAVHPYVGAFLRAQGFERLRSVPVDDPDYGGLERKRLGDEWERFVVQCDERIATGRALDSLGRREQIGPRRLDPLGLLGLSEPVPELAAAGHDPTTKGKSQ